MKWLKFLIALLLVPFGVGLLVTLTELFVIWAPTSEWRSLWFGSFCGGFGLFLILFFLLPKTFWVYVLGHELTHAWAVYLSGGQVYDFKVTSSGGHIKSDVVNWFIALSPYFIPLYSLIWTMGWMSVDFYKPLDAYIWIYYGGLGLTWAFHLCFTIEMILRGQSDLTSQGTFFSLVVILIVNLLFILLVLIAISPSLEFWKAGKILFTTTILCYEKTGQTIYQLVQKGINLL